MCEYHAGPRAQGPRRGHPCAKSAPGRKVRHNWTAAVNQPKARLSHLLPRESYAARAGTSLLPSDAAARAQSAPTGSITVPVPGAAGNPGPPPAERNAQCLGACARTAGPIEATTANGRADKVSPGASLFAAAGPVEATAANGRADQVSPGACLFAAAGPVETTAANGRTDQVSRGAGLLMI